MDWGVTFVARARDKTKSKERDAIVFTFHEPELCSMLAFERERFHHVGQLLSARNLGLRWID